MSQYQDTLGSMIGRVLNMRPGVSSLDVRDWINDRIRQALAARTYWSDLITYKVLSVPDPYTTGTVSVTTGSKVVIGSGTSWPVADVVNTTLASPVEEIGYVEATPSSMHGITEDSTLILDAGGANEEVVSVVEARRSSFIAKFERTHATAETIKQSSLVGMQFRLNVSDPIFTVAAVASPVELYLDQPWQGDSRENQAYRLVKMYLTISSDFKDILAMVDHQTGWPVRLHVPVSEVNAIDPRRVHTQSARVVSLVDLGPNAQGNMMYELWPAPGSRRQYGCLYYRQWPDLQSENDRPPWFINPSIFVHGAIADALRWRKDSNDPYFNPELAEIYERRFLQGLELAKNEDESKAQRAYQYRWSRMFLPMGADFWQAHPPEVVAWDFGPGY